MAEAQRGRDGDAGTRVVSQGLPGTLTSTPRNNAATYTAIQCQTCAARAITSVRCQPPGPPLQGRRPKAVSLRICGPAFKTRSRIRMGPHKAGWFSQSYNTAPRPPAAATGGRASIWSYMMTTTSTTTPQHGHLRQLDGVRPVPGSLSRHSSTSIPGMATMSSAPITLGLVS